MLKLTMHQPLRKLLLLSAAMASATAVHAAPSYTITEIGTLGGASSMAVSINNRGQVAGSAVTASGEAHPFLYDRGVMVDVLAGRQAAWEGMGLVNDLGQVAGDFADSSGTRTAFVYDNGQVREISAPGGGSLRVRGFNNAGELVGTLTSSMGDLQRGFVWRNGELTSFEPAVPGANTDAHGINASGSVAISTMLPSPSLEASIVGRQGDITPITPPGQDVWFWAPQINDRQAVAGTALGMGVRPHAMLFDGQSWTDLGALDAYASMAMGMNNRNDVVGVLSYYGPFGDETREAFAYLDGQMLKLSGLIAADTGWHLDTAMAINESGQIVGFGRLNGQERGFLLSPVPEPDALALVAAGVAALCLRRAAGARRRR